MKKSTKGAVAAGAAAALLLGGAGTLAFWNDTASVPGGNISSGNLALGTPDCGAGWTLDGNTPYTDQLIVPGDVLTKVCTVDLQATGEHLGATLGIDTPTWDANNALTAELDADAAFTVNGAPATEVTEADDTGTGEIQATVTVTFDGPAATNASRNLSAVLSGIDITATQTHTP